ncbi:MAG: XTP/dITP diphosphohydrolase [Bacteriovoracaceae bacterium]
MKEVYFVSRNHGKIEETVKLLEPFGIIAKPFEKKIEELQTDDMSLIVKDKLYKAFEMTRRPILVEHTGLELSELNGFPGGLTQIFWKKITSDESDLENFTKLFGQNSQTVIARSYVGFCDGKKTFFYEGSINGTVSSEPRGSDGFQWDMIFIPEGQSLTFAEMGQDEKNKISMRKKALESFAKDQQGRFNGK